MDLKRLLDAREDLDRIIKEMVLSSGQSVICITANTPGPDKDTPEALFLVRRFSNVSKHVFDPISTRVGESALGPYVLMHTSMNAIEAKHQAIMIEENHPLGRLIDLDLYDKDFHVITRSSLGLEGRKCLLCQREATLCRRLKTHTTRALQDHIRSRTSVYLSHDLTELMDLAMSLELNLEHKFGLVSKDSPGAHQDMDYDLMVRAKATLLPYFEKVVLIGERTVDHQARFQEARILGLDAEAALAKATRNVNCYKGLVFASFLFLSALGHVFARGASVLDVFWIIKEMTKGITGELNSTAMTDGIRAFQKDMLKGARGEAEAGYPSVKNILLSIPKTMSYDQQSLRTLLIDLIVSAEDTVLYKRCGSYDTYMAIKDRLKSLDVHDRDAVIALSDEMTKASMSPGGAADLLIVTIFMQLVINRYDVD
ncbi:MAG: citrate lyase holo-[acyl-carrier protein] synthase [Acholeplasmataceae bacterium]|nr:citrate lyase holo-[acyl-carrier protein] synthase [Acholeplasmataceae bacterium]